MTTATADRIRIIPVILLVIFVVLGAAAAVLVAPLVLLIANVLSFAATLGASALVFNHVFRLPGGRPGGRRCTGSSSSSRWASTTRSS